MPDRLRVASPSVHLGEAVHGGLGSLLGLGSLDPSGGSHEPPGGSSGHATGCGPVTLTLWDRPVRNFCCLLSALLSTSWLQRGSLSESRQLPSCVAASSNAPADIQDIESISSLAAGMSRPIWDGATVSAASAGCAVSRVEDVTGITCTPAHIATVVATHLPSSAPEPRFRLFFCVTARLAFTRLHAGLLLSLSGSSAGLAGFTVCRLFLSSASTCSN